MKKSPDAILPDNGKFFEYLKYNSYLCRQNRLLYVATPKVACTSLKWWFAELVSCEQELQQINSSVETTPELIIHDNFHKVAPEVTHLDKDNLKAVLNSELYFRFALVRNPYKRIFSAWQSKLLLREPYQSGAYCEFDFFNQSICSKRDVVEAFEGFLEHLSNNEAPDFWDVHWTPQFSLLRPDLITYSNISKIEDTSALRDSMKSHLGENYRDPFLEHHANESLIPFLPELISSRSKELIQSLYMLDFDSFGYSLQLPESGRDFTDAQFDTAARAITMIRARHTRISQLCSMASDNNEKLLHQAELVEKLDKTERKNQELAESLVILNSKNAESELIIKKSNEKLLHQAELVEKLDKTERKNQELAESLVILNSKNAESELTVKKSNEVISLMKKEVNDLNNEIRQEIKERESSLKIVNQQKLTLEGQISIFNERLTERNEEEAALKKRLIEIDNNNKLLKKRMIEMGDEINNYKRKLDELFASSSWKVTKPLRQISEYTQEHVMLRKISYALSQFKPKFKGASLPKDFDEKTYLELNPDLVVAGVNPVQHYINHGCDEGRLYLLPPININPMTENLSDRDTVLIVGHEASRTGAPILTLSLVKHFLAKYNVVVLLLDEGPLLDSFLDTGAALVSFCSIKNNYQSQHIHIERLHQQFNFKFAVVNSIEARSVLCPLSKHFVPTVSLVHEFASCYPDPYLVFDCASLWSSKLVFSTNVIKDDAEREYPKIARRAMNVFPQGKCDLPSPVSNSSHFDLEKESLLKQLRPDSLEKDGFVILGAGTVQMRKGVDLFIRCAARVVHSPGGEQFRFVWIGKGYEPEKDPHYSVYLEDQIRRSGLEKNVVLIGESAAIETAYENADIFLVSSRLDPLPNVAIDAMFHKLPVICFDKTTGIADFLIEKGFRQHCVAEYLDTDDMASKVINLLSSRDVYDDIALRLQNTAVAYFNMEKYVCLIDGLAMDAVSESKIEQADTATIYDSGLFKAEFASSLDARINTSEFIVRKYIRDWVTQADRTKPYSGFHPGIYLEHHGLTNPDADPFADYLRAGQPDGPWNYPVLRAHEVCEINLPQNDSVVVCIRANNINIVLELIRRISENQVKPDLLIEVESDEHLAELSQNLTLYKANSIDVRIMDRHSTSYVPLIELFADELSKYEFIGLFDVTQNVNFGEGSDNHNHFDYLVDNLVGNGGVSMADQILTRMNSDSSIGMVFPDMPQVYDWGELKPIAANIMKQIGITDLPDYFNHPIGSTFWAKKSALKQLLNHGLALKSYLTEITNKDSHSHSASILLGRLLGLMPASNEMRSLVTQVEFRKR